MLHPLLGLGTNRDGVTERDSDMVFVVFVCLLTALRASDINYGLSRSTSTRTYMRYSPVTKESPTRVTVDLCNLYTPH